jgi:hypothetical protein
MLSDYITPCQVGDLRLFPKFGIASLGWPVEVNCTASYGLTGWIMLPGGLSISWRVKEDPSQEKEIWRLGPLSVARSLTSEELEEYEENQAILAWEERELNRYTEWYY